MLPEFTRQRKKRSGIILTSLIDIIFLLVVFFMLTSKFVKSEFLDVNLSTVEQGERSSSNGDAIVIYLSQGSKFLLSGEEYSLVQLQEKLGNLIKDNSEKDIVLVTKKGVTVQDTIWAMDKIKAAGGFNISLSDAAE